MLNTMVIQLLADAEKVQYLYYFGDTVVYKAIVDDYFILLGVKQNPSIIYDISTLTEMLDSRCISICNLSISDTALRV